jgi:hypothetical protein
VERACGKLRGVSPECVDLLRRILVINPIQRASLAAIMEDAWFCQFLPDLSRCVSGAGDLDVDECIHSLIIGQCISPMHKFQVAATLPTIQRKGLPLNIPSLAPSPVTPSPLPTFPCRLTIATAHDVQGEEEILRIIAEAESVAQARACSGEIADEVLGIAAADVFDEIGADAVMKLTNR